MFIELTEFLRCPVLHEEMHLILVPDRMVGRMVVEGTIGCPVCLREFPVRAGIAWFDSQAPAEPAAPPDVDSLLAEAVRALLGLSNPGGYVVLIGSASALAPGLAGLMGGVHFIGVNAPRSIEASPTLSLVVHGSGLPLRRGMARGVVLGGEVAVSPWLEEGARVVLDGLRLVALRPDVREPVGVSPLGSGQGVWVGEKQRASPAGQAW